MVSVIGKMMQRYGTPVVLVKDGEEVSIRAFVQELKSKSQNSADRVFISLGEVPQQTYVYMGPVTPEAAVGDTLVYQQKTLELRRVELVMAGDEPLYCWGLCVEKGGESTWGS